MNASQPHASEKAKSFLLSTPSLSTRRRETGSCADTEVRMDKLTAEETKKQKRPAVGCQMQVRSGRVCVGADFGTDLVVATRGWRTLAGLVK
jgi:hypothetical protein